MSVGSRLALATDGMRFISESSTASYTSESASLSIDSTDQTLAMDHPSSFITQSNDVASLGAITVDDSASVIEGDGSISLD